MPTFTQKLEDFLDNNHPGGYVSTSVSISDSDLDARITANINNRGFLTTNSHIPWANIDNKPSFFSGNYNDLTNKPILFSGNYNDLTNKPALKPVATTGSYNDLLNKPSLFSGNYNDLTNKPSLFSGNYEDLTHLPILDVTDVNTSIMGLSTVALSNNYEDLNNLPEFAIVASTGNYADLINKPSFPLGIETFSIANAASPNMQTLDSNFIIYNINSSRFFDENNQDNSTYVEFFNDLVYLFNNDAYIKLNTSSNKYLWLIGARQTNAYSIFSFMSEYFTNYLELSDVYPYLPLTIKALTTAPSDVNEQDSQFNQDHLALQVDDNIVSISSTDILRSFTSTNPNQGSGQWMGFDIDTGLDSIQGITLDGQNLSLDDENEATSVGLDQGHIVFWVKAEDILNTTRTITLSTNGYKPTKIIITYTGVDSEYVGTSMPLVIDNSGEVISATQILNDLTMTKEQHLFILDYVNNILYHKIQTN